MSTLINVLGNFCKLFKELCILILLAGMFRCTYLDPTHGECRCLAGRLKCKEDRIYFTISKCFTLNIAALMFASQCM